MLKPDSWAVGIVKGRWGGLDQCNGVREEENWEKQGETQDTHRGREFVFVSMSPPLRDFGMVEVNESDWLVGVFLLVLRFALSQSFTFFYFTKFSFDTAQHEGQSDAKKVAKF